MAHLEHATVVLDHFHAIRLANSAIDDVRRRVQNETLGHRGRKGDPLYGIRRLLLVGHERLDERGWLRLQAGLAGDRWGEVEAAYQTGAVEGDIRHHTSPPGRSPPGRLLRLVQQS